MSRDQASPWLRELVVQQDIALLKALLRMKPEGPRDKARIDAAIEGIQRRLIGYGARSQGNAGAGTAVVEAPARLEAGAVEAPPESRTAGNPRRAE